MRSSAAMKSFFLFVLVAVCSARLCLSQTPPDCNTLNVEFTGDAFDGSALPYCAVTGLQCCSEDYLRRRVAAAREAVLDALKEELEETTEKFEDFVEKITRYFTSEFSTFLANHLPGRGIPGISISNEAIWALVSEINNAFKGVDDFNPRDLTENIVTELAEAVANGSAPGEQTKIRCLVTLVTNSINQDVLRNIIASIRQFQNTLQSFHNITRFLQSRSTVNRFVPLEACVDELVRRSVCGRCSRNVPPLCTNVCGALMRVCLSPFFTGLKGEYNALWRYTRSILDTVQTDIRSTFTQFEKDLIDFPSVLAGLSGCNISFSGRKRRETDAISLELLPDAVFTTLSGLQGVFKYELDGPRYCREQQRRQEECSESVDMRACRDDNFCTANCSCWDGEIERVNDIEQFTGDDITEQVKNPVLPVDQTRLDAAARTLGTPINDFLTDTSFAVTAPDGVEVPQADPYEGGGVSLHPGMALVTMLAAALLALFMT